MTKAKNSSIPPPGTKTLNAKRLEDENHDPTDWKSACEKAMLWGDTIYTGLFFKVASQQSLGQREPVLQAGPMARRQLGFTEEQGQRLIRGMM